MAVIVGRYCNALYKLHSIELSVIIISFNGTIQRTLTIPVDELQSDLNIFNI